MCARGVHVYYDRSHSKQNGLSGFFTEPTTSLHNRDPQTTQNIWKTVHSRIHNADGSRAQILGTTKVSSPTHLDQRHGQMRISQPIIRPQDWVRTQENRQMWQVNSLAKCAHPNQTLSNHTSMAYQSKLPLWWKLIPASPNMGRMGKDLERKIRIYMSITDICDLRPHVKLKGFNFMLKEDTLD